MPIPSEAYLRDLLDQVERDLAETEQRHKQHARVVSSLTAGTEARTHAERGLREIERTAAFTCVTRTFIQSTLD